MRVFIYLLLLSFGSWAYDGFASLNYTSLEYGDKPINNFASIYGKYEHKEGFFDGDLDVRGGITAHGMLRKSGDFDYFESVEDNRLLFHSLAIDYYPTSYLMLSAGRESLKINLLNGSFDGAMVVGNFDDINIRTFYFHRYTILFPSYYESREFDKSLAGVNISYSKGIFDSELSYFGYDDNYVSNLYTSLIFDSFVLGAEYLSFESDRFEDEGAYKFYAGYRYKRVYFEGGYYNVYEGALHHIYDLGATAFKVFGLNSFLNQEEAKNYYVDIVYNHHKLYTKLHLGRTDFKEDSGDEAGVIIGVRYRDIELSASYLVQEKIDTPNSRTQWVQTNLKYRF